MAKLLTSEQMQEADKLTINELGIPGAVLMENAGAGLHRALWEKVPGLREKSVLVLAGAGNNGGDGFVLARKLLLDGVRVTVFLMGEEAKLKGDARLNQQVYAKLHGKTVEVTKESNLGAFDARLTHTDIVVDALFGTGLTREVTGLPATLIERINARNKPVMAVDIPSGISADDGAILGTAFKAEWTVTFAAEKIGHRQYPGAGLCGEVILIPIDIPPVFIETPTNATALNIPGDLTIPRRPPEGHKGTFGHLLVVAGSVGKAGAAVLTASGALRTGPGLVTVATPRTAQPQVAAQLTEAMTLALPEKSGHLGAGSINAMLDQKLRLAAIAMGPGLGTSRAVFATVLELASRNDVPVVIDADAINVIPKKSQRLRQIVKERSAPIVLTPHPGELARLIGVKVEEIQADRLGIARKLAEKWGLWLVLKGAGSVIAAPDGRAWINATGNSGLGSGGSGDLLTGIIGGLLAQSWPVESAVRMGVWLHGKAADEAIAETGPAGLMASDLLPHVRRILNQFA